VFPIRDLNPSRLVPVVTFVLIAVNVIVFLGWTPLADPGQGQAFMYEHAAIACEVRLGRPLTLAEIRGGYCLAQPDAAAVFPDKRPTLSLFVSMFLHSGLAHLLGNMWFLYLFGNNVEEAYGHVRYLAMYLLAGLVAAFAFVLAHPLSTVPLVGASGAIAGVLGSYIVLYPRNTVLAFAFFAVIPVPSVLFLGLWFVGQFAVGDAGVAWESHVGGFVFGAALAALFRAPLLRRVETVHAGSRSGLSM
jgi:hypothetical protein